MISDNTKDKLLSILAVSLVVLTAWSCAVYATETEEEPDGFAITVSTALLIGLAIYGAGVATGWVLANYSDSPDVDTQPYLRLAAANNMTDTLSVAATFSSNHYENLAQVWGLTKEHWIRQAELEVYSQWSSGTSYDASAVLSRSHIYENGATMNANALSQFNSFLMEVSQKIRGWESTDTYGDGDMQVTFNIGNSLVVGAGYDWDCSLVSAAVGGGSVYIGTILDEYIPAGVDYQPAYLINPGTSDVRISSLAGSYIVPAGQKVYVKDLAGFQPGVYTADGTICGDTLAKVTGVSGSASVRSALAIWNGSWSSAVFDGDSISYLGNSYDSLSVQVIPSSIPDGEEAPSPVSLMDALAQYQTLLDRVYWTSVSASQSAAALWSLYDSADEKNLSVTTLMASNVYDSAILSEGMNQAMTISAIKQLADYYAAHGTDLEDLDIGIYDESMDAPFVRGTIYDQFGNLLYSDVIFTPFFQSDSVTMVRGQEFVLDQNTVMAIWASGQELVSWNGAGMQSSSHHTVSIGAGCSIVPTQLGQCTGSGMENRESIEFKVSKVNYISGKKVGLHDDPDSPDPSTNWLVIIGLIAGIGTLLYGCFSRRVSVIVIGAAILVLIWVIGDIGNNLTITRWFR